MGMESHFHRKQPVEAYTITEDFGMYRLESAEGITSQVVTAADSEGNDVTSSLLGNISRADDIISIPILASGEDRFDIKIVVTTDADSIYEQDLVLEVIDRP